MRQLTSVDAQFIAAEDERLTMSNVPGSRTPQYLAGARLAGHYPLSTIFHGLGLNITVMSYADQLDWGVVCDPHRVGDARPLITALCDAQAELAAVVNTRPRP